MKYRIIEDGNNRYRIQHETSSGWDDVLDGYYFTGEQGAVMELDNLLARNEERKNSKIVKKVIKEVEV